MTRTLIQRGFLVALFACAMSTARGAYAAQISMDMPQGHVGVGDVFIVPMILHTGGVDINALDADLKYTPDTLALQEIRYGDSIINFWVDQPKERDGSIHLSGIIPGGFTGASGSILSLVFRAQAAGMGAFTLASASAFQNDGVGTSMPLTLRPNTFMITPTGTHMQVDSLASNDRVIPELFTPVVAGDQALFDGRAFLVFSSQDKGSGVDHYEVAEHDGFERPAFLYGTLSWAKSASPHLLSDQSGHSYVYVRVVDIAGNSRVEVLSPQYPLFYYNVRNLLGILIVILLTVWVGRMLYVHLFTSTRRR